MFAAMAKSRQLHLPLPKNEPGSDAHSHFAVLDGWRALSIMFVLLGHLFPLGPSQLSLNVSIACSGMALFFTLSGFLITKTLLSNSNLYVFAVRRFFRIVPLAWAAMLVLLIANGSSFYVWMANLLFYANSVPNALIVNGGGHLWSLCVEMQIYVMLAILIAALPRIGVGAIPFICIAVTLWRISHHVYIDMATWYRCDEILAGGILALVYAKRYGDMTQRLLTWLNPLWLLPVLILSANPAAGALQYLRPYIAAAVVGSTLYNPPIIFLRLSQHRFTIYLATISYALYILHGALMATWLSSGDTIVKYSKRPLFIAVTFLIAHLSTFKFEARFIKYARRLTTNPAPNGNGLLAENTAVSRRL
ncbi:acyltransferase family protein [Sphingomonas sp. CFBP 8760]|uniref:acyltransferase family protein n=1 Tax=Sphingomonas sp. CFBP 8760 TaxID=2775282 RepID=UPI0018FE7B8B|nr:acyltransferase [Sphingomonas sp. CFBP 8760]